MSHRENFFVASLLLPRRLRQPFYNVYAFCRTADDFADASPTPEVAMDRLTTFQSQLDDTFRGHPPNSLFIALAGTIEQFQLSAQPFNDLLDAFRQDQCINRYQSFDQLLDYCRRSANPVGRIVLQLGGCLDEARGALSDEICTGLQLANFWQDVSRDFSIGRIYLPADEMKRFAVDEKMLAASSTAAEVRALLASECGRAEQFFRRGMPLADQVPRWLAGDVRLFAHTGLATLDAIRRIDFDVLRSRPTIGRFRKCGMLIRELLGLL